jgi:hypothetical protein
MFCPSMFLLLSCALVSAAQKQEYELNNGDRVFLDPSEVTDTVKPEAGNPILKRSLPRDLFARQYCSNPGENVICSSGCCPNSDYCCENRSCIDLTTRICCRGGYQCLTGGDCCTDGRCVCLSCLSRGSRPFLTVSNSAIQEATVSSTSIPGPSDAAAPAVEAVEAEVAEGEALHPRRRPPRPPVPPLPQPPQRRQLQHPPVSHAKSVSSPPSKALSAKSDIFAAPLTLRVLTMNSVVHLPTTATTTGPETPDAGTACTTSGTTITRGTTPSTAQPSGSARTPPSTSAPSPQFTPSRLLLQLQFPLHPPPSRSFPLQTLVI